MGHSSGRRALALSVFMALIAMAAGREFAAFTTEAFQVKTYNPTPYTPTPPDTGAPIVPSAPAPSSSSPVTPTPPYSPTPSGDSPVVPSPGTTPASPYYSPPSPSGSSPSTPDTPLVPVPVTPTCTSNCPVDPYPPSTPDPSVPANPAPSPSGTCTFWSSNTHMFPDFLTVLTTILDIFGGSAGSIFGSQMTLYQGLTNTRPDAFGSLLRQGSAAVLNSYTKRDYPYTPFQVKSSFRGAMVSEQAAAVQAVNFENANRGYVKRH